MGKIDEALQRLRASIAVQFGLDLANLLVRLGEKFAFQFVEFRIHISPRRAVCTPCAAPAPTPYHVPLQ